MAVVIPTQGALKSILLTNPEEIERKIVSLKKCCKHRVTLN